MSNSSAQSILGTIRDLRPLLLAERKANDEAARLTDNVVQAVGEAGLFRIAAPREVGGLELPLEDLIAVWEELGAIDPAVGWCVMNASGLGYLSARMPIEAARRVHTNPAACFGFGGTPGGRLTLAKDGVAVLSGRWPIVSGCQVSEWFALSCLIPNPDQDQPGVGMVVVPTEAVVIEDTWHVSAMRGTGSHAVHVDDYVVEEDLIVRPEARSRFSGAFYNVPALTALITATVPVVFGVVRSAITDFVEHAERRVLSRNGQFLRDQGTVQLAVVRAQAELGAARAGVLEAVRAMEAEAEAKGRASAPARAHYWGAVALAHDLCLSAVNRLQSAASVDSFRTDLPFDQAIRDARAMRQSFDSLEGNARGAGQILLGLRPALPI